MDEDKRAVVHLRVHPETKTRWINQAKSEGKRLSDWCIDLIDPVRYESTYQEANPIAQWRERMGLSQRAAAEVLGVSFKTFQNYEAGENQRGKYPAPLAIRLAMAALEKNIAPIPEFS